jgi:hypothetical protein
MHVLHVLHTDIVDEVLRFQSIRQEEFLRATGRDPLARDRRSITRVADQE